MSEQWESLTKKYAQAFLNLYAHQLSDITIDQVIACENFLITHKNANAFLTLSAISHEKKTALLEKIFTSFKLPPIFNKLSETLMERRCIGILSQVLLKIIAGYRKQKNIIKFIVSTSHVIGDKEKKELILFIEKQVSQKIFVSFTIDSSLICGIKIKSDTLALERSIAKQLKIIKLDALQRVQL